jgi:alpha/beta superfamily hydrolase
MILPSPALILLTGNSEKTKSWIEGVAKTLHPLFFPTNIQQYDHWGKGQDVLIDVDLELAKLEKNVAPLKHYALLGKSAGCLVILKGIQEKRLRPTFCVFLGLPVSWAHANDYPIDAYLNNYQIPTLFLQKEYDPAIGANDLASLLKEKHVSHHQLVSVPGKDHHYEDLQLLKQSIQTFMEHHGP